MHARSLGLVSPKVFFGKLKFFEGMYHVSRVDVGDKAISKDKYNILTRSEIVKCHIQSLITVFEICNLFFITPAKPADIVIIKTL